MKPPIFIQLTNHSSTQTLIHPTTENEFHSCSIFHLSVHTALMQSKLYSTDTFIIVYKLDKLNLLTACWLYVYSARIASIQPSSRANVLKYLISIYAYFFFFLHFILVCCFILFVVFFFLLNLKNFNLHLT